MTGWMVCPPTRNYRGTSALLPIEARLCVVGETNGTPCFGLQPNLAGPIICLNLLGAPPRSPSGFSGLPVAT